jgi:hypothetical protein
MPRSACRTTKAAIAAYWLGTKEGRQRLPDNAAAIDCGEPSCFACGWMAADPDEDPVLWQVWNSAHLQRCHLVPHALGGPDCPSNLVLLCARCHVEAPDVGEPDYMLRWIGAHQAWGALLVGEIESAMRLAGITGHQIETFNERFICQGHDVFRSALAEWAIPVGGRFSYATVAACAVESIRRVSAPPSIELIGTTARTPRRVARPGASGTEL